MNRRSWIHKLLAAFLLLGLLLTLTTAVLAAELKRGDMDGSGRVDVDDAIYLLRHTLLPDRYPINQSGDMDRDGTTGVDDAIYLLRHTLLPDRYPLECVHQAVTDKGTPATCVEDGLTDGSHCAMCGEILTVQEPIPAKGHTATAGKVVQPTCTEDGYRYSTCTDCGQEFRGEILPAAGHSYGDYKTTRAATCTEAGVKEHSCQKCGHTEQLGIPATGHNYETADTAGDTVTSKCASCGDTQITENPGELAPEGAYVDNCATDFGFVIQTNRSEAYIRENLTVTDDYFAGTQYDEYAAAPYELVSQGDGKWLVKPQGTYETASNYTAQLGGDLRFADHGGSTLHFSTAAPQSGDVKGNDRILFIQIPQDETGWRVEYDAAVDRLYVNMPSLGQVQQTDIGRILCVGDYADMESLLADPSKRANFGKLEAIYFENGGVVLSLGCPELQEVFEGLDIYDTGVIPLTEDGLSPDAEAYLADALYSSEGFAEFIAASQLSAEQYAREHGLQVMPLSGTTLKKLELKPTIKTKEDGSAEVGITGKLPIELKNKDGKKVGTLSISFTAKADVTFGYKAVYQMKRVWFIPTGFEKLDIQVTQNTNYSFEFSVKLEADYSYGEDKGKRAIYRTPNNRIHMDGCTQISMYNTDRLAELTPEEMDEKVRQSFGGIVRTECESCRPITSYLQSRYFFINTSTDTVHKFWCDSPDRVSVATGKLVTTLPTESKYHRCDTCYPMNSSELDFQQYMEDSFSYKDWGKVVDQVKGILTDLKVEPAARDEKALFEGGIPVCQVMTVNLKLGLNLEFKFEGTARYQYQVSATDVYGVRRNADGVIEPYHTVHKMGADRHALGIVGKAGAKVGLRADVYVSIVGLEQFLRVGVYVDGGAYANLTGVAELEIKNGNSEGYAAAYLEAGLYLDVGFNYKILKWGKDISFLGGTKEYPMIGLGYDKVCYAYTTDVALQEAGGASFDLKTLDVLDVSCFDVKKLTASPQKLSMTGEEGKYSVSFSLEDSTWATVSNGVIQMKAGAPCDLTVTAVITVIGEDGSIQTADEFYQKNYEAGSCGYDLPERKILVHLTNHKVGEWTVTTPAGCTAEGEETRYYICQCVGEDGQPKKETRPLNPLGHDRVDTSAAAATCTTDGRTAGAHCSRCDVIFVAAETIPMLGHQYADPFTCHDRPCRNTGCGHVELTSTDHVFTEWVEVPAVGCALESYSMRVCKDCGYGENSLGSGVPVSHPHNPGFARQTLATCEADGLIIVICLDCQSELHREVLPKLSHDWGDWEFTDEGHSRYCLNYGCGKETEVQAHDFLNDCDTTCGVCAYTRVTEHTWRADYAFSSESHWQVCTSCADISEKAPHSGGTATCTEKAKCADCNMPYGDPLGHDWQDAYSKDADSHWHSCTRCDGIQDKQNHRGGTVSCGKQAQCEVCGQVYGEKGGHSYGEKVIALKYLASEATCDTEAAYYYSCICGEKGTLTFGEGEALGHDWQTQWQKDASGHWQICDRCGDLSDKAAHAGGQASCTEKALCATCGEAYGDLKAHTGGTATCTRKAVCDSCGQEYGKLLNHSYMQKTVTEAYLQTKADCEHPAVYYYSCICGEKGTLTFREGEALGHDWQTRWQKDASGHWQSCDRCGDLSDKAAHAGGEASCTEKALCATCGEAYGGLKAHTGGTATCTRKAVCDSCGQEYGKLLNHSYTEKTVTDACLKTEATCDAPAVYYHSCICGQKGTATFENGQALGHDWQTQWQKDASGHWQSCDRCGDLSDKTAHAGGQASCTEKALCATCGEAYGDLKAHAGGTATCTRKAVCDACHQEYGELLEHSYQDKIVSETYLKTEATCEAPAVYYYSCTCGEQGEATFEQGQALGHDWTGSWHSDGKNHWKTCARCEATGQTAAHAGGEVTCEAAAVCETCQQSYGQAPGHDWSGDWLTDGENHWKKCARCKELGQKSAHTGGEASCEAAAVCETCQQSYGQAPGHDWSGDWLTDGESHWKKCARCEVTGQKAAHAGGEVTCEAAAVCATCQQSYGKPLGHDWQTDWQSDGKSHWYGCANCQQKKDESDHLGDMATCTEKAKCLVCKQEYGELLNHSYSLQVEDESHLKTPATCEVGAVYYYSCVCGKNGTQTFTGEPKGHSFQDAWNYSGTEHWKVCAECSAKGEGSAHLGGTATCTEQAVCGVCNQKYGQLLEHSYTERSDSHKASSATCLEPARYYYTCACGAKGQQTYEKGEALGHSLQQTYSRDDISHWYACGNAGCTERTEEAAHTYGDYIQTTAPTCKAEGEQTRSCTACGYAQTQSLPTVPHSWSEPTVRTSEPVEQNGVQVYTQTMYYLCQDCGLEDIIGTSKGHIHEQFQILEPVRPTCVKDGLTAGLVCGVGGCGEVYIAQEGIPATGEHSFHNGVCTACGASDDRCTHELAVRKVLDAATYGLCPDTNLVVKTCQCGAYGQFQPDSVTACDLQVTGDREETTEDGIPYTVFIYSCSQCSFQNETAQYDIVDRDACTHTQMDITRLLAGGELIMEFEDVLGTQQHLLAENLTATQLTQEEHGVCGIYIQHGNCYCGKVSGSTIFWENCCWSYKDSPDEYTTVLTCDVCGVQRTEVQESRQVLSGCTVMVVANVTYTTETASYGPYQVITLLEEHAYESPQYTMNGQSCLDGVTVVMACQNCGHTESFVTFSHDHCVSQTYDVSGLGMCQDTVTYTGCACGQEGYLDYYGACSWDTLESTETEQTYQCMNCQTFLQCTLVEKTQTAPCTWMRKENYRFYKEGAQDVVCTVQAALVEHDMQQTVTLLPGATSCEEGYTVSLCCRQCGREESWEGGGDHYIYWMEEKLLGEGILCEPLQYTVQGCPCGAHREEMVLYGSCQWGETTYDEATGGFTETCQVCGVTHTFVEDEAVSEQDPCVLLRTSTHTYTKSGAEPFDYQTTTQIGNHQWVAALEPFGATCEDGYNVHVVCTRCGSEENAQYYECMGWAVARDILHDGTGLCGPVELVSYDCVCGAQERYELIRACENLVGQGDPGNSILDCTDCGLQVVETVTRTRIPGTCKATVTTTWTLNRNGQQLLQTSRSREVDDHELVYTFNCYGATCADGYSYTGRCRNCDYEQTGEQTGVSCESSYYGESYAVEWVDFAQIGVCEGTLKHYSCPCGTLNRWSDILGCSFQPVQTQDPNTAHSRCTRCGMERIQTRTESIPEGTCEGTATVVQTYRKGSWQRIWKTQEPAIRHDLTYQRELLPGVENCEDGIRVTESCQWCDYTNSYTQYGHMEYDLDAVDLSTVGVCAGQIRHTACICGQTDYWQADIGCDLVSVETTDTTQRYRCSVCGLEYIISRSEYFPVNTCQGLEIFTYTYQKGDWQRSWETQEPAIRHDLTYQRELLPGAEDCEGGTRVTESCQWCDYTNSHEQYGHISYLTDTRELSYSSTDCDSTLELWKCVCGKQQRWDLREGSGCKLKMTETDSWISNALDGVTCETTQGAPTYHSTFYTVTCEDGAMPNCGLTARYAEYWLLEGCEAVLYQVWQLGYDPATGSFRGQVQAQIDRGSYHEYTRTETNTPQADGTSIMVTSQVCPDCGSSATTTGYLDDQGRTYKWEYEALNTLDNGEPTRSYTFHEWAEIHEGIRYYTLIRSGFTEADGSENWNQDVYSNFDFAAGTCTRTYSNFLGDTWTETVAIYG